MKNFDEDAKIKRTWWRSCSRCTLSMDVSLPNGWTGEEGGERSSSDSSAVGEAVRPNPSGVAQLLDDVDPPPSTFSVKGALNVVEHTEGNTGRW